MIKTIIRRLREKREREAATSALIARRAMRASNRRADVAAAYEAKHLILAQGKRNG
jgi:hypothetical protein